MQFRFVLSFALYSALCLAQYPQFPKDYFMFPIKPGQQNYLSGTMGELRPNHFHGGIDIKTDQRTGLPVYAAAEGYISRMVVSSKGYGNTMYITHPNGLRTVYAHLEWPFGKYGKYLKDYLYNQQCNETDLLLMPGELVVKKGDTIALSGNSGSSGGPHLHFEIRDKAERLMNPLFFNFQEIKDKINPYVNKIALRTLDINSRVEGEFGRFEFIPIKSGENYVLNYPIHAYGILGLELVAYDHMDGTSNSCGISLIDVKIDGKETFVHDIQKISFDDNPYINQHLDYQTYKTKGNYFQKLYVADGNCLNTYCSSDDMNGKIMISDTLTHKVEVTIYDAYRNRTTLKFKIKGILKQLPKVAENNKMKVGIRQEEQENTLKLSVWGNKNTYAQFSVGGQKFDLSPTYYRMAEQVYLLDLRKYLPDSMQAGALKHSFRFNKAIPSQGEVLHSHPYMDIKFPNKSIFDTIYLDIKYKNGIYSIHNYTTALFSPLIVTLKPDFVVPNKQKTSVYNVVSGKGFRYGAGEWIGNQIRFKTKLLGDFVIRTDTVPPRVKFFKKVNETLYFFVSDNMSGIANWYGYLNGKFLLMQFDPKYNVIFTNTQNNEPVKGDLFIGISDQIGNKTQHIFKF